MDSISIHNTADVTIEHRYYYKSEGAHRDFCELRILVTNDDGHQTDIAIFSDTKIQIKYK